MSSIPPLNGSFLRSGWSNSSASSSSSVPHPGELPRISSSESEEDVSMGQGGEAENLALAKDVFEIERLPPEIQRLIVQYVTNNGNNSKELLRVRLVNRMFRGWGEDIFLSGHVKLRDRVEELLAQGEPREAWNIIVDDVEAKKKDLGQFLYTMRNVDPIWRDLIEKIMERKWGAMLQGIHNSRLKEMIADMPRDLSYFDRFAYLRLRLAKDGCPLNFFHMYDSDYASRPKREVIGFTTVARNFEILQEINDISLELLWRPLRALLEEKEIFFEGSILSETASSRDIRKRLKNPRNKEIIARKVDSLRFDAVSKRSEPKCLQMRTTGLWAYFTGFPREMCDFSGLTSLELINSPHLVNIPPEISNFSQLTHLNLSGNESLQRLPREIGDLASLRSLDLSQTRLDSFPKELGKLSQLTSLNLSKTRLDILGGLPWKAGNLLQLTSLDLSENSMAYLPSAIQRLSQLTSLNVRGNMLGRSRKCYAGDSPDLSGLTGLKTLDVAQNQLTFFPSGIGELRRLEKLDVSGNELTDLPEEIVNLSELRVLDLSGNRFGKLPPQVGSLGRLEELYASNDRIRRLPQEIGRLLPEIKILSLGGNQLSDLPEEIGELHQLTSLNLSGNNIIIVPPEIGNLDQLARLNLAYNHYVGLPQAMSQLSRLTDLYLGSTRVWERAVGAIRNRNLKYRYTGDAAVLEKFNPQDQNPDIQRMVKILYGSEL